MEPISIDQLDTPAIVIDLDRMERNLAKLSAYCQASGLQLRPHTKTHKIPELAKRQIAAGAHGITVAKIGEARVMAEAGLNDILIAYPIVSEAKARELAALAERARVAVSLDSLEAAQAISRETAERGVTIGMFVEVDVGFHRCGLGRPEDAVALAREILRLPGIEFRGLMYYPGHMLALRSRQLEMLIGVNESLDRFRVAFDAAAIPVREVSGGSTPTAYMSTAFHWLTEVRPGMYLFNDRNMVGAGVAAEDDCALSVLVTVVSTAVPGRAIVDGGSKTFSSDRFLAGDGQGFGIVTGDPRASLEAMSEEHGHLNVRDASKQYRVGDRLRIIPNHVCTAINMHERVFGLRGARVEEVWEVAGRGKLQ
jgi:D-serine deaminase-like pyridoxal phosphate-dependent protein